MKKILLPLIAFSFAISTFAQNGNAQDDSTFSDAKISIYPNPAKNFVVVNNVVELGVKEIEVFDILSKKVKVTFTSGLRNSIKLDLNRLSAGMYFVKFYDRTGNEIGTKRIHKIAN